MEKLYSEKKSLSIQIDFLTVEKRQKSDGNLVEEVQYIK